MSKTKELLLIISANILFLVCLVWPTIVLADASTDIDGLLEAIASKNYPLAVGFALSILVYFARRILPEKLFPKKAVPYIVLVISIIGGAGTGLVMFSGEGMVWWHGLLKGLLEGLSAGLMSMGFWSSSLKSFLKFKEEEEQSENTIVE